MSELAPPPLRPQIPGAVGQRPLGGRLRRLVLKELREILRDRRTIITLVVMPILIYPLLAVVFQRFLLNAIAVNEEIKYDIGVDSEMAQGILGQELQIGDRVLANRERNASENRNATADGKRNAVKGDRKSGIDSRVEPPFVDYTLIADPDEMLMRHVADSSLHVAALYRKEPDRKSGKGLRRTAQWELVYRAGSPTSEAALHFVESRLQAFNDLALNEQLKQMGVAASLPAATIRHPISFAGAPAFSLAALIPLILVLMTVTGAVYPAIDLTAGERERGTLETLIAAPVPRLGLLLAKYVAVLTVAILTALVNLTAMTITANSAGLGPTLFGGGGMTFDVVVKVLLLLVLFAAFFSAILLALTSFARSFKEAQAYIIPLMLLCLVPGVLCLMPNLDFTGWMAVMPLVNIVMLSRDLLEGKAVGGLAIVAVCSTIFYIGGAIALAARIFGTDAILYGSQATWSDLVRRPAEPQSAAGLPTALLSLALMFPCYFVLASALGQSQTIDMDKRLVISNLISALVLGGIPLLFATFNRTDWRTGLGLRPVGFVALFAAIVLGFSLWPIAEEIFLLSDWLGLSSLSEQLIGKAHDMIARLRTVPIGLLLVTMGLVPSMLEEFCFRGFLFGALRTRLAGASAIVISALVFGIFHELFFPGRFLASTFLGLVLGWVRHRTGSILPGIVLHAIHNSLLLSIIYYQQELTAHGWGIEEQKHLPIVWHAVAFVGIVFGVIALFVTTRGDRSLLQLKPRSGDIT